MSSRVILIFPSLIEGDPCERWILWDTKVFPEICNKTLMIKIEKKNIDKMGILIADLKSESYNKCCLHFFIPPHYFLFYFNSYQLLNCYLF